MKKQVVKTPKVALCRQCGGTGIWRHWTETGVLMVERCPQCEGTGRVTVSAVMEYDIRPYKPQSKED